MQIRILKLLTTPGTSGGPHPLPSIWKGGGDDSIVQKQDHAPVPLAGMGVADRHFCNSHLSQLDRECDLVCDNEPVTPDGSGTRPHACDKRLLAMFPLRGRAAPERAEFD